MIKYGNDWHCYYLQISKDLRSSLCYYYLRTQTNSYPCSAEPTSHFHNYYSTSTWAKDGLNCMENFCHGALSLMGLWSCTTSERSSLYRPSLIETFPYFNFMSTLRLTCVVRYKCFTIENPILASASNSKKIALIMSRYSRPLLVRLDRGVLQYEQLRPTPRQLSQQCAYTGWRAVCCSRHAFIRYP